MLSALASACSTYILFLSIHWIPFRLFEVKARTRMMTLTLLLCLPSLLPFFLFYSSLIPQHFDNGPWAGTIFYAVSFFLLWCGYVQFVFSFDTSPSLRVLVVLLDHPEGLSERELLQEMDFRDTFRRRFQRAVAGGAIRKSTDGHGSEAYGLTPASLRLAQIGKFAKEFFKLGAGG